MTDLGRQGKPARCAFEPQRHKYGDLIFLNVQSRIRTPNLERMAAEGLIFTDAHAPSAVCTPTRYGVTAGRYCWRSPLTESGVIG
jgi:arylsulfatase A-like enzyme